VKQEAAATQLVSGDLEIVVHIFGREVSLHSGSSFSRSYLLHGQRTLDAGYQARSFGGSRHLNRTCVGEFPPQGAQRAAILLD